MLLIFSAVHVLLIGAWLVFRSPAETTATPGISNYLFLLFFCTGVIIAGTVLRKKIFLPVRIYFSLFLLSAVLFVFNPSMVIGFIVSGNPVSINPGTFHLYGNVYMMQQQSALNPDLLSRTYKITKEMGVFHKTLVRDIALKSEPDSVAAEEMTAPAGVRLKFFYFHSGSAEVLDTVFYFGTIRDSSRTITRKPGSEYR